jgi:TRAP-type mannitol/chloroaromatic compound transport system substrate-binding protein
MPIEILLIAVLILLLISIVLNIFTYFKIEKEKNSILKELSNYTNIISQIVLNIQQIQKGFQHFETLINENKNEFKTELSKLHKDILINIESKYKSMDEKMIENKDRMEYAINLLMKTGLILKEFEKEITDLTQSKYEELFKEVEENYKKIQELEKKIEHIIKLLKEPLTEEDLR